MQTDNTTPPTVEVDFKYIYDLLMTDIEPDLVTGNMPYLDAAYEGESEDDREVRLERYRMAFEVFTERYEQLMDLWHKELAKGKSNIDLEVLKKELPQNSDE